MSKPRLRLRKAGALVPRVFVAEAGIAQAVARVIGNGYMTGQTIVLNGGMAFT